MATGWIWGGFFMLEPNPWAYTHYSNSTHLINGFFCCTQTRPIRPCGPLLAMPNLGPLHSPIKKLKPITWPRFAQIQDSSPNSRFNKSNKSKKLIQVQEIKKLQNKSHKLKIIRALATVKLNNYITILASPKHKNTYCSSGAITKIF